MRVVSAVAAVVVALAAAVRHDLFARPNWLWLALAAGVGPFLVDLRWPLSRPGAAIAGLSISVAGIGAWIAAERPGPDVALLLVLVIAARVGAGAPARVSVPVGLAAIAVLVYLDLTRVGVTSLGMVIGVAFAWSAGVAMRVQGDLTAGCCRLAVSSPRPPRGRSGSASPGTSTT